jgi:hypothetical protein
MEDQEVKATTKFQSPLPFIIQLRNLIFGKKKPDTFTKVTFIINLIICSTFLLWSIISYYSISMKGFIEAEKGISVEEIIANRGMELGFKNGQFLSHLLTFHAISIICWMLVFIGIVLLYRKKIQFIYFIVAPTLFYVGMSIFYISYTYFIEDTTTYDKIALLVIVAGSIVHYFLMRNESSGGSINFFGAIEDEEEA